MKFLKLPKCNVQFFAYVYVFLAHSFEWNLKNDSNFVRKKIRLPKIFPIDLLFRFLMQWKSLDASINYFFGPTLIGK